MAFKEQPLKQEEFCMTIIQDLGQIQPEGTSRRVRHALFECTKCKKHFVARATGSIVRLQKTCKQCTLSENQEYTHPLYAIWNGIKQRCHNPKRKDYPRYGGKGITLHEVWRDDFKAFYNWCLTNGWNASLVIDKDIKSRELGITPAIYSPDTLSFVTQSSNAREASGRTINQYTLTGEYIATFSSAIEAAEHVGLKSGDPITNCCRGNSKSSKNFKWEYA